MHGGADAFVGAMDATYPAARAALARLQCCNRALNVSFSCLRLLDGNVPADPFVASERRQTLPDGSGCRGGNKCLL